MNHHFSVVITLSVAIFAQADDKNPPNKPAKAPASADKAGESKRDAPSHEGVWLPIAAVLGGAKLPDEAIKAITLRVSGENYEVAIEGKPESDKGTCSLDTTTSPKRMTIKSTEGPNRGKTILAIYEMKDADSMRVCYDLSGKEFPTEFQAPKGTQLYLVGYRRQKSPPMEKTAP